MQLWGILAAMFSSALGGTAVGATRYLAGSLDPVAIGVLRFGGGVLVLAPLAVWRGEPWPRRRDWAGVAALGLLFFGLFPVLFNASLGYTTAARGALALSTLPLLTMAAGALLRIEPPTWRKTIGVLVAIGGVVLALGASLNTAPPGAWRGDLLMVSAALCMALYNVWSRPFIARAGPVTFAASGMVCGALALGALALGTGSLHGLAALPPPAWGAVIYLAAVCGALIFFLWAYALGRVVPTIVAVSVAVNPVTASIFGLVLLHEPVSAALLFGLAMVLAGIAIASGLPLRPPGSALRRRA